MNDYLAAIDAGTGGVRCVIFDVKGNVVSEDYRGRHLSQQLVKLAENQIKQIGFHKAYIVTKHVGLYEKLGYEQIDTSVDQLGRKMRILAKQL